MISVENIEIDYFALPNASVSYLATLMKGS